MSIVGKPFIFSGGTKSLDISSTDAIVRVLAVRDASVILSKNGKKKRPDAVFDFDYNREDEAYYYFIIEPSLFDSNNEWTVTASADGDTRYVTVIVDAPYEYTLEIDYSVPAGFTRLEYIGYPGVSAVNTYYFTVPNPFAGFTFSDTFRITSKHTWAAQTTTNQGPYGNYSNSAYILPTLLMGASSPVATASRHVLRAINGAASDSGLGYISNIKNYNELHEYVLKGVGQNANDDLIPDWKFNEEHLEVHYDDTLFGLEIDGEDRELHYYLLPNTTTDHDNGLIIDIPFISGVKYTCSCTLTTPTDAWICFRRSDNWESLLGAPDGWAGVSSGTYTFSFTASENIRYGKLCIYTAGGPWNSDAHFDEVIISNLTLTANTSSLLLFSSYDDGLETGYPFGYTTTLMDTNSETPFYVGQYSIESGMRNFSGQMYSLDIEINDEKVLSYIPCKRNSDDAVGFYDSVGKQFHRLHKDG